MFNPVKKLNPGDSLSLTCVYDTSKVGNTVFGPRTKDEMCVEFLFYWPVQKRRDTNESIHVCGFVATNKSSTGGLSFCGNGGNIEKGILPVPNPSINDSTGSLDKFGSQVKTCSIAESPSSSSGKESSCFPDYATVKTQDGSEKLMRDLKVGDVVLVAPGTYSAVFMFTHNIADRRSEFVRISTVDGFCISLSRSHYLYVNGMLKQARSVKVGDFVTLSCGRASVVNHVAIEVGMGLYNPQTLHGDIVVSGIIASTYTSAIEPSTAHALLAPFRSLFVGFGASTSVFEQGADNVVNFLSKLNVL
jgi:Hint module/Copper type II ascorbate-dependent monooxygenase, C-terminal domain